MELENVVNLSLGALAIAAAALHSKLTTRSPNILSLSSPSSVLSKLSSPLTLPTSPSGLYLGSHLPAIFSEWIQSAHIFQVYKSAGQEDSSIALMFLFSSLTSALFGSLLGPIADKYGRKKVAQTVSLLCIANCLMKGSNYLPLLFLGRLVNGVTMAGLYTVPEGWLAAEQKARELPETQISSTLAQATSFSSLLAVAGGLLADLLVTNFGLRAPFLCALPGHFLSLYIITFGWQENFGQRTGSVWKTYQQGFSCLCSSKSLLLLGSIQALVESSMSLFLFLWPVTMANVDRQGTANLPLGRIFSALMVSVTLGSMLTRLLRSSYSFSPKCTLLLSTLVFLLSTLLSSTILAKSTTSSWSHIVPSFTFFSFCLSELSLGLYFPSMATIRSELAPAELRSTVATLARLPLNIISSISLIFIRSGLLEVGANTFLMISSFLLVATFLAAILTQIDEKRKTE